MSLSADLVAQLAAGCGPRVIWNCHQAAALAFPGAGWPL